MASSEVDMKFLGKFAENIQMDQPLLARNLFQIFGNLVMLSKMVVKARKLRRLDTTRDTPSLDLYCRIIWYAREGLKVLEEFVMPLVSRFGELKVLVYKLRASYYHLYVITLRAAKITTPPGLTSLRERDKGKGIDLGQVDPLRPSSVQPTHPLEGGPVGGPPGLSIPPPEPAPGFLVPAADYRPLANQYFLEASGLADHLLWGSHPLRLSVKVEFAAFLYDCLDEKDHSRRLAKQTVAEVYNADEGMDDEMFEDAAELVSILGRMVKRGLGSGSATPGGGSSSKGSTIRLKPTPEPPAEPLPPMHNPI
ncbi:hypothetical protein ACMFMG_005006 [Clarireedia jacksonii]